jgi:hypothetical protein
MAVGEPLGVVEKDVTVVERQRRTARKPHGRRQIRAEKHDGKRGVEENRPATGAGKRRSDRHGEQYSQPGRPLTVPVPAATLRRL